MRILLKTLLRLVYTDQFKQLFGARMRLRRRFVGVQLYDLGYLVAYRIYRVKAGHRILEYYRDLVPTDLSELLFGHFVDLMSVKADSTADKSSRICGKTHYRICGDRFS